MGTASVRIVRLTLGLLARGDLSLARRAHAARADVPRVRRALVCSSAERRFARALLERRTNLWLLRVDQRAFGGDFLLVDASEPEVARRSALVLELKRGERVRRVSAERTQVRNARAVVVAAARATRVVLPDAAYTVVLGDPEALLLELGALPGVRAPARRAI